MNNEKGLNMTPHIVKQFFIRDINTQKCFFYFKTRILISAIFFLAIGCEGRKATENGAEVKTNNYVNTVFGNGELKSNILLEEGIPLSDFFQNSKIYDSTFKVLRTHRVMAFELSSDNPDLLGLVFEPEAVTIEAIKIVGDYAYMSDAVHGNVKKIHLKSGSMISSKSLEKERFEFYLQEIALFNDFLYVITHRNKIFKLTLDLELAESFFIPDSHYNINYLFSDRGEKLIVFSDGRNDFIIDEKTRPSEYIVDEKTKIFQRRLHIDDQLNFSYDTLSFKNHSEYREWITTLRGVKIKLEDKPFYFCNDKKYEVPLEFEVGQFYGSAFGRNINCSDKYLAFFDISLEEKKLYLHVFEY